jgi:hypothetical protein
LKYDFSQFLSNVTLTDRRALVACLSIGFFVRLIPELLAFPFPIGFDTIHYAAAMKSGVIWTHWSTLFTSSWLLYALIVPLYALIPADPFLLLKIVAPLLYGLNVAGIYWFSRKMLGWDLRMGLLAGGFFALQLASLRISWDLLRNTLGLGILLFTLLHIKEVNTKRGFAFFVILSLLTVFAHEYAALTLLVVVIGLVAMRLFKEGVDFGSKRLVLAVLPALTVFMFSVFLRSLPVSNVAQTNIIYAGDTVITHPGGVFFLVDYLSIHSSVDYYASYWTLALSVGVLFAVLYLPYLFLVVKGFFKDRILGIWTGFLLIGAIGCLIFPFSALEYWHRWMFMLVYPLTFYAVNGFGILKGKLAANAKHYFSSWLSNKKPAAMILLTSSIGTAYLTTPVWIDYANVANANTDAPSVSGISNYFAASPTVPYEDVNSVVQSMNWLNENLGANSCVALQHAFLFWGQLYLDKVHSIVHFEIDASVAIETALNHDFSHVYFVWWNEPIGWYCVSVPEHFVSVQNFGRISVYLYEGENVVGS